MPSVPGSSVAGKSGETVPPLLDALVSPVDSGKEILQQLVHPRGSALNMGIHDTPARGLARCIGELPLRLEYGEFKVYTFELLPSGENLLAITKGDISSPDPLLIRMHSECVTSETLRGCDCDCVEQLNGALKNIADEERGVVFYLRQEGRGAGYSCKSRDRMVVAASNDLVHTFEAYDWLGLKQDPRNYEFMSDIYYLLGINSSLRVMTNNPKKIEGMEASGLVVEEICPLIMQPNPYNDYYLRSKGSEGGHLLDYGEKGSSEPLYPWPVEVFKPYRLSTPGARRFSHMASYPLPIRPPEGVMMLDAAGLAELSTILDGTKGFSVEANIETGKFKVRLDRDLLAHEKADNPTGSLIRFIVRHPYWFNDHVYHDHTLHKDFVALTYDANVDVAPLVRVQSENLLQRLPVRAEDRSTKYETAIQEIVQHGRGMLLLYPEDGRGKGFSTLFLEKVLIARGLAHDNAEANEILGCEDEQRDFRAVAGLIRHHYGDEPVQLLLGSPDSKSVAGLAAKGVVIDRTFIIGSGKPTV